LAHDSSRRLAGDVGSDRGVALGHRVNDADSRCGATEWANNPRSRPLSRG
jgi:hypothetical protein